MGAWRKDFDEKSDNEPDKKISRSIWIFLGCSSVHLPRIHIEYPVFRTAALNQGRRFFWIAWENTLSGFQCLDWPKYPSGENAINDPKKNCRPQWASGFRAVSRRSLRSNFHREATLERWKTHLLEVLEPTPRCLEDPRRALSMQGLPESPFGEIRHHLRKKQDTL